jgi:hypothetical protein
MDRAERAADGLDVLLDAFAENVFYQFRDVRILEVWSVIEGGHRRPASVAYQAGTSHCPLTNSIGHSR